MKFLCDRCNTRYSIGDERVRGKILKIRCKNCSNVITVREGMIADPEAAQPVVSEPTGRAKKATTIPPAALDEGNESARGGKDPASVVKDRVGVAAPGRPAGLGILAGPGNSGVPTARARPPVGAAKGKVGMLGAAPAVTAREPLGTEEDKARPFGAAQPKRSAPSDPSDDAARGAVRGQGGAGNRGAALAPPGGEPVNALNAAFASAMAKPPPALEEEWYVSIDGDQAGPFSLAEAQRWVAQKAEGAELHCWSEGFDDWLPVDKVSHFRGLRKRPAGGAAPPPLPRGGVPQRSAPAPAAMSRPVQDEPKPLFAATMASLERGAPVASNPSPASPSARATPPLGIPSRSNPLGRSPNGARVLAREPGAVREADRHGDHGAPVTPLLAKATEGRHAATKPASAPPGPARSILDDPFDTSEAGDAATQLEAMPFADSILEPKRASQPAMTADPAPRSSDAALTTPHLPAASTLPGTGANAAMTSAAVSSVAADFGTDGDEELAIGEVSRVVKLADIARESRNPDRSGPVHRKRPASIAGGRRTGANAILRSTGSVPILPGATADSALAAPGEADPGTTMAPIRKSHRRGLFALLGVAGVMVLGVVAAVILLVTTSDDPTSGNLGSVRDIDTSRPEDPITHRPLDPAGGSAGPTNPTPANPFVPRPTPHPPRLNPNPAGSNHDPEPPPGNSLRGDEIEDIARKHQDMTQRCYLRSQRGADSILIGDVKKIAVTLMIDKDGNVSDVQLSEHATDNLGKCLSGSIRGWKFRQSSGGTFRFSLNFVSG